MALLPSVLKKPLYRMFWGYSIGKDVRIGFSLFVDVRQCTIADGTRIGHFNLFIGLRHLHIGEHVQIGLLNVIRGGDRVSVGAYSRIIRMNVLNAIPDAERANAGTPTLEIGAACVITDGHRLDFTDRITLGPNTIIGGRSSSFWTHNRQRTRPITIGSNCYFGSEVRVAPGVEVAEACIISLGAVLMGRFEQPRSLILGNPACVKRALREAEVYLVEHPTRRDLPLELRAKPVQSEL